MIQELKQFQECFRSQEILRLNSSIKYQHFIRSKESFLLSSDSDDNGGGTESTSIAKASAASQGKQTPQKQRKINLVPQIVQIVTTSVFRLEHPVKVSDRDEKLDREMNQKIGRKHSPIANNTTITNYRRTIIKKCG